MELKLVIVSGKASSDTFDVTLPARVGRSREANVVLSNRMVSRLHCQLFESDGRVMVRDLGSLNGTFVSSNKISEETWIKPGELLSLGPFTIRVDYVGAAGAVSDPQADTAGSVKDEPTKRTDQTELAPTIDFEVDESDKPASASASSAGESDFEIGETEPKAAGGDDFDMDWLNDDAEPPAPKSKSSEKSSPPAKAGKQTEADFSLADEPPTEDWRPMEEEDAAPQAADPKAKAAKATEPKATEAKVTEAKPKPAEPKAAAPKSNGAAAATKKQPTEDELLDFLLSDDP